MASGDIAKKLEIPAPTLSFHMTHLSNAKLVNSSKIGRSVIYTANFERMQGVLEYLLDRCSDITMLEKEAEEQEGA